MSQRPDWEDYFLGIAEVVASRADCTRRKVGAVLVRDHRIVSTGYNGAAAGRTGCLEGACPRGRMDASEVPHGSSYDTGMGACIALHAEQNAIIYADYDKCQGATLYVTCEPCDGCLRMIEGAGIRTVIWPENFKWFTLYSHENYNREEDCGERHRKD